MDQIQTEVKGYNPVVMWICRVMTGIATVVLGLILVLAAADISGRIFFLHPIEGVVELIGMLMVIIGFLGLGYCQLVKGNVMIDIITSRFSQRGQAVFNIFSYTICIVICGLITWQGGIRAWLYIFKKTGQYTVIMQIIYWPFMLLMAVSFAWVTVIFILDLIQAIKKVVKR
jgi:TRAP-type C4-dicarboxylate transport system permease small subunit